MTTKQLGPCAPMRVTPREVYGVKSNQVIGRFSYSAASQMIKAPGLLPWQKKQNLNSAIKCLVNDHYSHATNYDPQSGEHSSWTHGSLPELYQAWEGNVDMAPFELGLKTLGSLKKQLDTAMQGEMPRRKRCFSEHDGEWSYDRRFEIQPFSATQKRQTKNRSLDIYLYFDMLAVTPVEHGNKFGVLAWAVSRLVEMSGITTRIIWVDETTRSAKVGDKLFHSRTEIVLKEMGEFLAPSFLAAALSTNFYRRAGFAMIIYTQDQYGHVANPTVGGAFLGTRKPVSYEHGALHISMEAIDQTPESLLPEIKKAVS